MRPAKQVLEDALQLDPDQRIEIAQELLASVDSARVRPEFAQELERRVGEIDSGAVKTVAWSEVKAELDDLARGRG